MRWHRFLFSLLFLAVLAACHNPAGPRFPRDEPPGTEPDGKNKQGFVITDEMGIWA